MREAYTAVIARAEPWSGVILTEPYETGWAGEVIIFALALESLDADVTLKTLISPDGINWVEDGSAFVLPREKGKLGFLKLRHFGHFLRFTAEMPPGKIGKFVLSLALKE
ncbi:MAG TPA: hypothetical protein VGM83_08590 [Devosiaceae bacterium]|jgi:hypothetical protein